MPKTPFQQMTDSVAAADIPEGVVYRVTPTESGVIIKGRFLIEAEIGVTNEHVSAKADMGAVAVAYLNRSLREHVKRVFDITEVT